MTDIRVACAQCGGRGRLLKNGASMTHPCGRCGGTGFVTMPDPQPELTRLRAREAALVEALTVAEERLYRHGLLQGPDDPVVKALATLDVEEKM